MFESIFQSGSVGTAGFFTVVFSAFFCGVIFAVLCCLRSKSSKSFGIATATLPMAVAVVIMLVNGNLGVGVAIAGAFGLVRFRSAPGTAREIAVIFIAMASGLAFGMGYLGYGAIFLLFCGLVLFAFEAFANPKSGANLERYVKITIPESLDYTSVFDGVFGEFTVFSELERVKSVNMGSMFRLSYRIKLKNASSEKAFLDSIRERNGNLEVILSRGDFSDTEL